jgi:hypothetical protein
MGEPIALGDIALCQHGHHQVPQRPGEIALSDHDGPLTHADPIDGVARAHILITSYVAAVVSAATPAVFGRVAWCASAAIPVAVLVVLIQRRLSQGAVAGQVVELGEGARERTYAKRYRLPWVTRRWR